MMPDVIYKKGIALKPKPGKRILVWKT